MKAIEKWSVWVTSVLTGVTGAGYFVLKYFFEPQDPFSAVGHPLEPWFLKAHILVSPLLLVAVGMILVGHVWRHFRSGVAWGRKSGILTALALVPMTATGYLIQVLSDQGWLEAMAIAHIGLGALFLIGIGAHQWVMQLGPPGKNGGKKRRGKKKAAMRGGRKRPGGPAGRTGGAEERADVRPNRATDAARRG